MINLDDTRALKRIAEALERIAEAEARGAEPAGVPILLIVEVLIALINILWRNLPLDAVGIEKLGALKRRLEPYQPVRPAGKEAE